MGRRPRDPERGEENSVQDVRYASAGVATTGEREHRKVSDFSWLAPTGAVERDWLETNASVTGLA